VWLQRIYNQQISTINSILVWLCKLGFPWKCNQFHKFLKALNTVRTVSKQYHKDQLKVWSTTYNFIPIYSLNWHTQQCHQNTLRDFIALTIIGLSPTHSATLPKRSEGFFNNICSYGPTTTQQQGYYNLLQDLRRRSQINLNSNQFTLGLVSLCEI